MALKLELDACASEVDIRARRPLLTCTVDGVDYAISENRDPAEGDAIITLNGTPHQVWRVAEGDRVHLKIGTRYFTIGYEDAVRAAAHDDAAAHEVHADMPGVVVAVRAISGMIVAAGDALLVIESMKMQITVTAPRDGVIDAVHVAPNEPFQKGAMLVALRRDPEVDPA